MVDCVIDALERALGDREGRIGVAVSGGRDSMVLLEIVAEARGRLPCLDAPVVLHLDHGLRPESAADARLVEARALSLGLEVQTTRRDVVIRARDDGGGLEEAARTVRYAWLEERARALGLIAVLTAHHADDQVETVAMQAMRGSPVLGLGGIPRTRRLSRATDTLVLRPLLDVPARRIEAAAAAWGVPFHDDVTNTDLRHRRNLLRHVLIPVGETRHELRRRLSELGTRAGVVNRRVARLAAAVERDLGITVEDDDTGRRCSITRAPLRGLPIEVSWSVLDRLAARCHPGHGHLGARSVARMLESEHGETLELARDLHVDLVDRDGESWVVFRRTVVKDAPPDWSPLPLRVGGSVRAAAAGITVRAELVDDAEPTHSPFEQWLDPRCVAGTLVVRPARHGERLRPFGMIGSKLVSDLFAEAGVAAVARWSRPVVADDDGILWIPGVRASERCRVTGTRSALIRLTTND